MELKQGEPIQKIDNNVNYSPAKKSRLPFIILITLIVVIILGTSFYLGLNKVKQDTEPAAQTQSQPTPFISPTPTSNPSIISNQIPDICGSEVLFKSYSLVQNTIDAEKTFNAYITYMKDNNLKDRNLATDWNFTAAESQGYYLNKHYWKITFSYTMEQGEKGNAQTSVNEDGEIVQLLGCI